MKNVSRIAILAIVVAGVSCSSTPAPTSPTATAEGVSAANADGSTLKVTAPAQIAPAENEQVASRKPTFVWLNSTGVHAVIGLAYEFVVVDAADAVVYTRPLGDSAGINQHVMELELPYDKRYFWRIRALLDGQTGPWSPWAAFRSPPAPVVVTAPPTVPTVEGTIGPARVISFNEAFGIIVAVHNGGRFNLGGSSSREYRVAFMDGAVAVIHYGHARYNPQGPDNNWCVKDAGGGRPQSDDVLVRCRSREAWDLISGAGGNNYSFHADYLGILSSVQNVYPPQRSSLNFIGR